MYRLTFLGTSSAIPTDKRGLSSILLINVNTNACYMFDCGGGTGAKFYRFRKYFNAPLTIFLTHSHPDHLIGILELIPILSVLGRTSGVDIIGEPTAVDKIKEAMFTFGYLKTDFPFPITTSYVGSDHLAFASGNSNEKITVEYMDSQHSVRSIAYRVTLNDMGSTKKIGISGDTRPTDELRLFFGNIDYLIFESTYDHCKKKEAKAFLHCTNIEAAQFARAAGVGKLFLTHISPDIEDIPSLAFETRSIFPKSDIPYDGFSVKIDVK